MTKVNYLTKEGRENLENELLELKTSKRKEISLKIKEAKEYGDLSENSEYEEAKNQQAFVEGRIAEVDHILKHSVLISNKKGPKDCVSVGCSVTMEIEGELKEYIIVGSAEADPMSGKISNESAIGKGILGRKVGEEIPVPVDAGHIVCKIKKIQ